MDALIHNILIENDRRNSVLNAKFDPYTGEGAGGDRVRIEIPDFTIKVQYVPRAMLGVPLVRRLIEWGSIENVIRYVFREEPTQSEHDKVAEAFVRVRIQHDFPFWAALFVLIKNKEGGDDIHFRLNAPQRKLTALFEEMRVANKPIRVVVLKARQWGGSTLTQIYMSWIQLVHKKAWNSIIVGHEMTSTTEVRNMFAKMLESYPINMMYEMGKAYNTKEPKVRGTKTPNIDRIPPRNCNIKLGTAERPDSARGGDSSLVHCTEIAFWKTTEGKTPQQIVRSACSGAKPVPYSMIVYESTANGTGNFFQRTYDAAKRGDSSFRHIFVSWFEIEGYQMPFDSEEEKIEFAEKLIRNRKNTVAPSAYAESGAYLYRLWEMGATLEGIKWYIFKRGEYEDHGDMAAEFPSDDVEAFVNSGANVFDKALVDKFKGACCKPRWVGEIEGRGNIALSISDRSGMKNVENSDFLKDLKFIEDDLGHFSVWSKPEPDDENEVVTNRYLVTVDIGGRGTKADWSVICVFDRIWMIEGGKPSVVAQWYGHIDMDLLAWKAAQIAKWYNNALLVIESNTLETKDRDRHVDGDQTDFILIQIKDVYDNLYARKQSEQDIRLNAPVKYGFHTNMQTKPMIISTLVKVIREQSYVERDEGCLDEYNQYEKKQNGSFGAIIGKHDDKLMTRAIGLHICFFEMDMPKIEPRHKMMARRRVRNASEAVM